MKKIALIIGMFTLVATLVMGAIPVSAAGEIIINQPGADGFIVLQPNEVQWQSFTPDGDYSLGQIQLKIYSVSTHTNVNEILIVSLWQGTSPTNAVFIQPGRSAGLDLKNAITAGWNSFNFYPLEVVTGTEYWVRIQLNGSSETSCTFYADNYRGDSYLLANGVLNHTLVSAGMKSWGVINPQPVCSTIAANINTDGLHFHGALSYATGDMYTSFEYGYSTGVYTASTEPKLLTNNSNVSIAYFTDTIMPESGTIYYRALANNDMYSLTGDEMSFDVVGVPGVDSPNIETNQANIEYTSFTTGAIINNLGTDTTVEVFIDWGYTSACSEGNLSLGTYTALGQTKQIKITANSASQIFYVAKMVGDTDTTYGKILQGHTQDPSKSAVINIINGWLDKLGLGPGVYWILLFVLMMIPWFFAPIRQNKFIGIILDVVLLGFGITMLLDIWVTILLIIVAGVVFFGLIRKPQGAG